jgi:hypothetical protein
MTDIVHLIEQGHVQPHPARLDGPATMGQLREPYRRWVKVKG